MRRLATLLPAFCLLLPPATPPGAGGEARKRPDPQPPEVPKLALELRTTTPVVRLGEAPRFTATLTNKGGKSVTLVLPGDGSESGWRTPVLTWNPKQKAGERCGNVNPLGEKEVVTLAPGKSVELGCLLGGPVPTKVGKHQASLTYENDPRLKWSGGVLGKHDPKAMEKVRASTAVKVTSNAVEVEVLPAKGGPPPARPATGEDEDQGR